MSVTVVTLTSALKNPTGLKVKYDILDTDQTVLIHDFSKNATYPSQAAAIADGTELVNLSTTHALKAEGLVSKGTLIAYDQAGKCINLTGQSGGASGADWLHFGSAASPYPQIVESGEVTDLLVSLFIKIVHTGGDTSGTIATLESTRTAGANSNLNTQLRIFYGATLNTITVFALGQQVGYNIPYVEGQWMHLGIYIRPNTYNAKTGLVRLYKNGLPVFDATANIPNAFFTTDTTKKLEIGSEFGGWYGSLGRMSVLKGIGVAGLDPNTLIAADFGYGASLWAIA